MITGDNPLTAVHVARDVEIVDRDALILDVPEGTSDSSTFDYSTPPSKAYQSRRPCVAFGGRDRDHPR